jgi:hypothetical protein
LAISEFELGGAIFIWVASISSRNGSLVNRQLRCAGGFNVFGTLYGNQYPNYCVGSEYGNDLGRALSPQEKPRTHTDLERSCSHTHYPISGQDHLKKI